MLNWLTNATKKRVIREIRKILYNHPRYRGDSDNVVNKYSFEERPQRGVIINSTSADRVRLSADNYMGRLSSFLMHTRVGNYPNTTLEWVRENNALLEQYSPRRNVFPSPPGVYLFEVKSLPNEARSLPGFFTVEPVLTVQDEALITFSSSAYQEAQLSRENIYPGSVRLWLEGRRPLLADVDFSVDPVTGVVTFLRPTPSGMTVYADYRYKMPVQGPFQFFQETSDLTTIPGAVLAFGDRPQERDKFAVVVSESRTDVAEIYGGKFETSFELVVFSRDSEDREKMSDFIIASVLERQNVLGFEGLELLDISPGGESEEIYNAETDDYYYESSVSLSIRVDWQSFFSLPVEIFRAETTSKAEEQEHGYLDGTVKSDLLQTLDPANLADIAGVATVIGRDISYERVK